MRNRCEICARDISPSCLSRKSNSEDRLVIGLIPEGTIARSRSDLYIDERCTGKRDIWNRHCDRVGSLVSEDRLWWYRPRRRARIPDASGRKAHLVSSFFSMFTYNLTACIVSSQNPHVSCLSRLLTLNITFTLYYRSQPGNEPLVPRTFEVPLYDIANAMRLSVCLFICFFFFLHHFLSSSSALFFFLLFLLFHFFLLLRF